MPNVYASLPLSGSARHFGRELLRGAELALERRWRGPWPPGLHRLGELVSA